MLRIPSVQFLIVRIISQLRVLLVGLNELNRLKVREFCIQIIQIEHESNDRILRSMILQKVNLPANDEPIQNVVQVSIEHVRVDFLFQVDLLIGQPVAKQIICQSLKLVSLPHTSTRVKFNDHCLLYLQIVHVQL